MIYQLGEFQFDGETSYNSLDHQKAARWMNKQSLKNILW